MHVDTTFLEYIAEEIAEEARAGYLTPEEGRRRLALLFGDSSASAAVLIRAQASLDPAVTIPENDPAIAVELVSYPVPEGSIQAYLARPRDGERAPGIVVVHENKGLVPYIRDVARRLARHGYVALAPDLLSPVGGTDSFSDPAEATAALGRRNPEEMVQDLREAVSYLAAQPFVDAQRLGAIGFCFGGGMTWRLTCTDARLKASVPFYGPNPPLEQVPNIRAAVLGIYGGLDERINAGIPAIEAAMAEHQKVFEKEVYPGAQHAFHNDTNPDRYHPEAARAAWVRATEWFQRHLGS